jgi:hypothetical protein
MPIIDRHASGTVRRRSCRPNGAPRHAFVAQPTGSQGRLCASSAVCFAVGDSRQSERARARGGRSPDMGRPRRATLGRRLRADRLLQRRRVLTIAGGHTLTTLGRSALVGIARTRRASIGPACWKTCRATPRCIAVGARWCSTTTARSAAADRALNGALVHAPEPIPSARPAWLTAVSRPNITGAWPSGSSPRNSTRQSRWSAVGTALVVARLGSQRRWRLRRGRHGRRTSALSAVRAARRTGTRKAWSAVPLPRPNKKAGIVGISCAPPTSAMPVSAHASAFSHSSAPDGTHWSFVASRRLCPSAFAELRGVRAPPGWTPVGARPTRTQRRPDRRAVRRRWDSTAWSVVHGRAGRIDAQAARRGVSVSIRLCRGRHRIDGVGPKRATMQGT